MPINKNSLLCRTNQTWKHHVYLLFLWVGVGIGMRGFYLEIKDYGSGLNLIYTSMLFIVIGFLFAYTIKCPKCHKSIYWHACTQKMSGDAFVKIIKEPSCPICGYIPDENT